MSTKKFIIAMSKEFFLILLMLYSVNISVISLQCFDYSMEVEELRSRIEEHDAVSGNLSTPASSEMVV